MTEIIKPIAVNLQRLHADQQMRLYQQRFHHNAAGGVRKSPQSTTTNSTVVSTAENTVDTSSTRESHAEEVSTWNRSSIVVDSYVVKKGDDGAHFEAIDHHPSAVAHNLDARLGRCNPALSSQPDEQDFALMTRTHRHTTAGGAPAVVALQTMTSGAVVVPKFIRISPTSRQVGQATARHLRVEPAYQQNSDGREATGSEEIKRPRPIKADLRSLPYQPQQPNPFVHTTSVRSDNNIFINSAADKEEGKDNFVTRDPQCRFPLVRKMAPIPSRIPQATATQETHAAPGAPAVPQHYSATNSAAVAAASALHAGGLRPHQARMQSQFRQANLQSPGNASSQKQRSNNSRGNGSNSQSSEHSSPKNTPLFQRLVSDEVQELKSYARIIETQNRRLAELERVHADLEARLEEQNNVRLDLERTLEARERQWADRVDELEKDRDSWKGIVQTEQAKNSRLQEQVARKDQDIHAMLLRKYDNQGRQAASADPSSASASATSAAAARSVSSKQGVRSLRKTDPHGDADLARIQYKSPHEILASTGSVEVLRERNVSNALLDFFGL